MTDEHLEIAALRVQHGATFDDSVLQDHLAESTGSARDEEFRRMLEALRAPSA